MHRYRMIMETGKPLLCYESWGNSDVVFESTTQAKYSSWKVPEVGDVLKLGGSRFRVLLVESRAGWRDLFKLQTLTVMEDDWVHPDTQPEKVQAA